MSTSASPQPASDELLPPLPLCKLVGSPTHPSFKAVGKESVRLMRELAGLKPTDRVLEIGCGCGRVAIPLTGYLKEGAYEGFDVVIELVQWSQECITPRYPNFRFTRVDLYNDYYNPGGGTRAEHFEFPYAAGAFDFILLNSVFTHMHYADVRRYLQEMHRTLAPGGTALASFFILNAASERLLAAGSSKLPFEHRLSRGMRANRVDKPSSALAYPESTVRTLLAESGFEIQEPVHFGFWCGRQGAATFQDYFVLRRAAVAPRRPGLWQRLLQRFG